MRAGNLCSLVISTNPFSHDYIKMEMVKSYNIVYSIHTVPGLSDDKISVLVIILAC